MRFSFSSVAAVAALEELCCSSVAAAVSNVKSISFRIFVFILQHPAVLSLPPARPRSLSTYVSEFVDTLKYILSSPKQGNAAGDTGDAGRNCSYKHVLSCRANPGDTKVCFWGQRDTTYAYTQSQHTSPHPLVLCLSH